MAHPITAIDSSEMSGNGNPYFTEDFKSGKGFHHKKAIDLIKDFFLSKPNKRLVLLHGPPGFGKTSTLKQIELSPERLGKNYIPIYLDSRKYINLNLDDLEITLYRDTIDKLNEYGIRIQKINFFRAKQYKGSTLERILTTVDAHIGRPKIMLLIFDEIDSLIENTEITIISDFIEYFKSIEREWHKYALIFAGDTSLLTSTSDPTVRGLLDDAYHIDLEKVLDEDQFKEWITLPVRGNITFDYAAIEKIKWYSGRSLYFQQLICHYLYNYLGKHSKKSCASEDICETVKLLLSTPIVEFGHMWEKLYSTARIILSSLMDISELESRGNDFALKVNSLLGETFSDDLPKEIARLTKLGYIHEMKNRLFLGFPFKIPLFGKWIKKEHPFIKTVIENIDVIATRVRLERLTEVIDKIPGNKLAPFEKEAILSTLNEWITLSNSIFQKKKKISADQTKNFFKIFGYQLNLEITPLSPEYSFRIDVKSLKIGTLENARCFIQDRPELSYSTIHQIESKAAEYSQEALSTLTVFFYFKKTDSVEQLTQKVYLSLVSIDQSDLLRIVFSEWPDRALRKTILEKLSLSRVSPYKIAGPADATFYGRKKTLNKISGTIQTSYSIVGARKIGKSSLLHKIKKDPSPTVSYVYMSLEVEFTEKKSYKPFFKKLSGELQEKFNQKFDFSKYSLGIATGIDFDKLPQTVQKLSNSGKRVVFIFDEVDGFLRFDKEQEYKLLRIFRTMSQDNICQFIFAGFMDLYKAKRNVENPMFNFGEEIILESLDQEAATDLITKPMESIGVHYYNDSIKELVLGYTACHPNLLQFFCRNLIDLIEKHRDVEKRRTIFNGDVEKLYNTKKYEDYVTEQVYMFSSLNAASQLILIKLAEMKINGNHFNIDTICEGLKRESIQISSIHLEQNLNDLIMKFILMESEELRDYYTFSLSVFPEILRKRYDSKHYKRRLKEEVNAQKT